MTAARKPFIRPDRIRISQILPDLGTQVKVGGFWLGPIVFLSMLLSSAPSSMAVVTWFTMALALWMIIWWVTEAVSLSVTALLPALVLPMLGVMDIKSALVPYANPIIFLFLGGFVIAIGIEKSNLHQRIALGIVRLIGTRPDRMIGGFMAASGFLSMWISNTASMLMMLPIGLSIISLLGDKMGESGQRDIRRFATGLLLGLAFASSVGGVGTLIGTPPNAILAGYLSNSYDVSIPFLDWMLVGVPTAVVVILAMWFVLAKWLFRVNAEGFDAAEHVINQEIRKLGPMTKDEKMAAFIALATAMLWVAKPLYDPLLPFDLHDAAIALIGALALFVLPLNFRTCETTLQWKDVEDKLPWGVLILFGGGLSLAGGFQVSGLGEWVSGQFSGLEHMNPLLMMLAVAATVQLATSLMSNVAAINIFVPILVPLAIANDVNPLFLAIPATISASCAFMLPVSTANNAIAFGTGRINIKDMVIAGLVMNVISLVILMIIAYTIMLPVFGIEHGIMPDWAVLDSTLD